MRRIADLYPGEAKTQCREVWSVGSLSSGSVKLM
jgi:hypothetical protein